MTQSAAISPHHFTSFGALLRYLRERVELSQKELASQVGYHYSYMCRIEKNQRMPDANTLVTRFIPALELDDQPQWTARLLELSGNTEEHPSPVPVLVEVKPASPSPVTALPIFDLSASNLPIFLTPVLGRNADIASLTNLINRDDVRLITVMGPPGVGKTRLAAHLAAQLAGSFMHGPLFVDMTPITDANDFLPALAQALGVQETSDAPLIRNIIAFLRPRSLLLILDNFEHVIQAGTHLPNLLLSAPNLKIIATSREALRVSGEHEFNLAPLPLPQRTNLTPNPDEFEQLAHNAAIQLFAQRAQAVQPEFKLTVENISVITEVCEQLDGLPLAIELAAVRIRTLAPQAMLQQLDRRLEWLTRGSRDSAKQTLRGAIEWSYNLLTEPERALLRRLSVFMDGCTLRTAESVCVDESLPREMVLDLLVKLMDKSLATLSNINHQVRYHLLETVREFAREKLSQTPEADETRARYVIHFAEYAEDSENHLDGVEQAKWIRITENESGNFRTTLDYALTQPDLIQHGLRIGAAISLFWLERNHFQESTGRMQTLLNKADAPDFNNARAKILYRHGAIYLRASNLPAAYKFCEQSIELARTLADKRILASALFYLGETCITIKDYNRAEVLLNESIAICRANPFPIQLTIALTNLAKMHQAQGDFESAIANGNEALAVAENAQDTWGTSQALQILGAVHQAIGKLDPAIQYFEKSLQHSRELGDHLSEGLILSNLSLIYSLKEDYHASGHAAEKSYVAFQAIGDEAQQPFPLRMMGYSAINSGNVLRARALIRESLKGNYSQDHLAGQLACLIAMGMCDLMQNNAERAVTYAALVENRINADAIPLLEPDTLALRKLFNEAKNKLGEKSIKQIIERSKRMRAEEMIASELPAAV